MKIQLRFILAALALVAFVQTVAGQGNAFTYQGKLTDGTNTANGVYDLKFTVFDALTLGAPQGGPLTNAATGVSNGLFTVTLNFGAGVFNGANRWLEIQARTNGVGAFIPLTPRQPVTPSPYAIYAGGASASGLSGTIGGGQIAPEAIGTVHLSNSVSLWNRSGNNIYYTNGNVGVGTATPQSPLHVGGAMKLDGSNTFEFGAGVAGKEVNAGKIGYQTFTSGALDIVGAGTPGNSRRVNVWDLLHIGDYSADAGPRLITFGDADLVSIGENGEDDRMELTAAHFVFNNGGVGIGTGTSAPAFPLSFADALGDKISLFGLSGNHYGFGVQSSLLQIHTSAAGEDIAFGYGRSDAFSETMRIKGNGDVGIGTTNPASKLHVNGTITATSFIGAGGPLALGTTNNQALELKVNNLTGLRLQFGSNLVGTAANVIGGYSGNVVSSTALGATIAGGGGPGAVNQALNGGDTVSGGFGNTASGGNSTVSGGTGNSATGQVATVGGGRLNTAGAIEATVGGGRENLASANWATVPGGLNNTASGLYSFAAGHRAKANHPGAFVWADSQNADFASTAADQFLIRAAGGVGIFGTIKSIGTTATLGSFKGMIEAYYGDNDRYGLAQLPDGIMALYSASSFGSSSIQFGQMTGASTFAPQMTVDHGGNVGIGTTAPAWPLDVNGSMHVGSHDADGTPKLIRIGDGDYVSVGENGEDDRMELTAGKFVFNNGNVGIATTNPATRLTVNQPGYGIEHTDGSVRISTYLEGSGGYFGTVSPHDLYFFVNDNSGAMVIRTNNNAEFFGEITTVAVNITSDRNAKEQFKPVNARDVLNKVARLPISEWQYKTQTDARHIGPMAQDFHAAFAVGRDDKHITSVDADGVALAAIQGLNEKFDEQTREKDARIHELEKTVAELKELVGKLAGQQTGGAR